MVIEMIKMIIEMIIQMTPIELRTASEWLIMKLLSGEGTGILNGVQQCSMHLTGDPHALG
jgi:hypothetical protein